MIARLTAWPNRPLKNSAEPPLRSENAIRKASPACLCSTAKRRGFAAFALFCGLALAARAQIGSGWTTDGETYTAQTSAGTSITAISGGFQFTIPVETGLDRAEERGNNLPTTTTNQWQGLGTLVSFPAGAFHPRSHP
jgi:hypothetical protein